MQTEAALPPCLRIGVTGHRDLPADAALVAQVRAAIAHILATASSSLAPPQRLVVVSPLAEGADRLVAEQALTWSGATLVVPLPLPYEQYIQDFHAAPSRRQFDRLIARAERVTLLPPTGTRTDAYEQVGRYVVDHSDAVIAIWDGQHAQGRGGTADVVAYTRARRVPLWWIAAFAPYRLTVEPGAGLTTSNGCEAPEPPTHTAG